MTNTKETKPTLIFIISMEIHVEFPTLKLIGPILFMEFSISQQMKLMFWRWHWTLINAINLNIHTFYSSTLFVFFYRHLLCFKRTEKEGISFFRVSYYSKAGIDNTCIMIKKCLRAFKNIRKTYATCVDQNYFQGGLQRIIFFCQEKGVWALFSENY